MVCYLKHIAEKSTNKYHIRVSFSEKKQFKKNLTSREFEYASGNDYMWLHILFYSIYFVYMYNIYICNFKYFS